jgi:hypothetical protein
MMDARSDSDYEIAYEADPVTARDRLDDAHRFVERIASYLWEMERIE